MKMRKMTAILLALLVALTFTVPAFASAGGGYGPGTVDDVEPYEPSTSGPSTSGGGGGGGGTSDTPPANAPQPATPAQVNNAVNNALAKATTSTSGTGSTTAATLTNVSTVPATALQSAFEKAAANEVELTIQVDKVVGNTVMSRVYIDSETASQLSGDVNLSVTTDPEEVKSTTNTFNKYFDNEIAVVGFGQKGAFGAEIPVAVKLDLSKLNTTSLVFYAYDKDTNSFTPITPEYFVDANGYLHFKTPVGGDLVITDKPLTLK